MYDKVLKQRRSKISPHNGNNQNNICHTFEHKNLSHINTMDCNASFCEYIDPIRLIQ